MSWQFRIPAEHRAFFDAEGKRRGCNGRQLAAALLFCIARDGMVDAILDGEAPGALAGRERLSPAAARVLAAMTARRDDDGCVRITEQQLADTLDIGKETVGWSIRRMLGEGRISRVGAPGRRGRPSVYRILIAGEPS